MTTKYRSKNAITTWWEQASRNARIGAIIAGAVVGALLLIGIGYALKTMFTVTSEEQSRVDTTVKLPEKGIEASDIPSTFETPSLAPINLPTPSPTPTPTFTPEAAAPTDLYTPSTAYPSEDSFATEASAFPGSSAGGSFGASQYDALAAQVRPICGTTEVTTSSTGATLLRSYQQWGRGEFASFLPCLDAMVIVPKDAGIDVEVMVQDGQAGAAFMSLRAEDVRQIGNQDKASREQQLRKVFQVAPGRQLK